MHMHQAITQNTEDTIHKCIHVSLGRTGPQYVNDLQHKIQQILTIINLGCNLFH